jgi:hypothetical protein
VGGPVGRQFAGHAAVNSAASSGNSAGVGGEAGVPVGFQRAPLGLGVPGGVDVGRDLEGAVVPADVGAGGGDFGLAERRAVARRGCPACSASRADDGLAADQGGLVGFGLAAFRWRSRSRPRVMAVDVAITCQP